MAKQAKSKTTRKRQGPKTTKPVFQWKIDNLPDIQTLSIHDGFMLWNFLNRELDYRGGLRMSENAWNALVSHYDEVMDRIQERVADVKAESSDDILWKIRLYIAKWRRDHAPLSEDDDLLLLETAADCAGLLNAKVRTANLAAESAR